MCYLWRDAASGEAVVVDPGSTAQDVVDMVNASDSVVRRILLTHAHYDHVGAVAEVCRAVGTVCAFHPADAPLLRQSASYAFAFEGIRLERPAPCEPLEGATAAFIGAHEIGAIHTPGHTPGSVCYRVGQLVATGDTLLRERVARTDLPGGDTALLRRSITMLLTGLPDDTLLLPGHGTLWTAGEARRWWSQMGEQPTTRDTH